MKRPGPRILIVGAQHGDERLGPRLQRFLARDTTGRFEGVDYLCGNPRAYHANTRYIETDLNRSYVFGTPQTYEERRARVILQRIAVGEYDFVLDVHTSTADVGCFFLAAGMNVATRQIIHASAMTRVALMPPDIAAHSLIGRVPQAISIECDQVLARSPQALAELARLLDNLLAGRGHTRERELYQVRELIPNHPKLPRGSANFVRTAAGFYPILYGEHTYTAHQGFAAYEKTRLML